MKSTLSVFATDAVSLQTLNTQDIQHAGSETVPAQQQTWREKSTEAAGVQRLRKRTVNGAVVEEGAEEEE